jgi:glycosyltransferase involved in cell wall biosynthesis
MNILAIPTTYGFSHPISGGQNRFSNLITELKKRGNNIILLESNDVIREKDGQLARTYSYKDLKLFNRNLSIFKDFNFRFIKQVFSILNNEDINLIQITHPSGAIAIKFLCMLKWKKIPIVYDAHNVESNFINETFSICNKYSKIETLLIYNYTILLEKIVCKFIVDHITSVSKDDRTLFLRKYQISSKKISVVPSGAYLSDISSLKGDANRIKKELGIDSNKLIVIFHGSFSHPPNKRAYELIESYIAPKFEEMNNVLFLVGGSGFPKFRKKNIMSIGFIDDLYRTLSIADIAIIPLTHGAGTKLKIFDYLCVGLPIISTNKGIEGIDCKNGEHAIIVEDVNQAFIDTLTLLLNNKYERIRIGSAGLKLVSELYDWEKIGLNLQKIYLNIEMYNKGCFQD